MEIKIIILSAGPHNWNLESTKARQKLGVSFYSLNGSLFKTQRAFWLTASFSSQIKEMMNVIVTPLGVDMVRSPYSTQKPLGYEEQLSVFSDIELKDRMEDTLELAPE